jgi:hypothetical protein
MILGSYEINPEKLAIWHGVCNSKWYVEIKSTQQQTRRIK